MRAQLLPSPHHQRLLAVTVSRLCAGGFLLLTTLVPARTALLGWTPVFWLLAAPLIVLLTLEPGLPRQLLRRRLHRLHVVHTVHGVIWH
ncbi:hypothetical protein B0E47_02580 [Rhodanobacter sp. B05]|uniref:hypothetical protein n=1 Tax=Rhodanobacter sp. B05 TaxID=1945859 RepID=UPI00098602C2|nr:hypothetical protein [Rhodanobacter sp. B05]OOG60580.1 hypothetical protein B0E47_02580 [Rhodanobacter sp. B05]